MSRKGMRVQWKKGIEFAEFAESLKINTDQIVGVRDDPGGIHFVFYSPTGYLDEEILVQMFDRGPDGILRHRNDPIIATGLRDEILKLTEGK